VEKLLQFRHAHFRNCHAAPPALASLASAAEVIVTLSYDGTCPSGYFDEEPDRTRRYAAIADPAARDVGSIAVLTLNRPEARNSLSEGLIAELACGAQRDSRRCKACARW
jgi:hypothetical protein